MDTEGQNYQEEVKYAILTQKILGNKDLTPCDKMVLARISGFSRFYESSQTTADFLGIGEDTVKKSKQKLAKLGYIVEVGNTGRGKIYAPNLLQLPSRVAELTSQTGKIYQSDGQILPTENKERIKREYKGDDNVAEGVENSKKEYGRADVNELAELWESETGISIKGQQNERRQLYNLLRKYGYEATKTLVRRVGATKRSRDRYAPQIAVPSDLTGKYSKLPRMQMWEERNQTSRPFGQSGATTPAPAIAVASLKQGIPDYNGAWTEQSDEEFEKVSEMMKKARDKLNF